MPGVQVHNAETTETADEDLPVATVTEVVVNEPQVVTMPEPTAAQPTAEVDEAAEPKEDEATTQGAEEEVTEMVASQNEAAALPVSEAPDPRRWRRPLPYTFHYVHGGNVRLCSSDTVAQRISGFDDAIAIVSQPLRRGHNFRFRVDRVSDRWSGSASLGAVVSLPETLLPFNAIHLDPPAWIVSSETYHANGVMYMQDQLWRELEECITEQSVLSIHFRFNGELIVEVNGKMLFNMGIVERSYSHVFPLIDLYGRIEQVSILLHPHVVSGGMSLDLPIIMELEEALSDLENDDEEDDDEPPASPESARKHKKIRAYSHDNLMDEEPVPLLALPGTSSQPDPPPQRGVRARNGTLHQSFILADGTVKKVVNLTLKKSYSSHTFRNVPEDPVLAGSRLVLLRQLSLNVESQVWTVGAEQAAVHEHLNDTNIRHNDRYPEAGDVDNLDSEIIDALTLETGNLPDLSEEQSSSIDESTRRDDIWAGLLAVENMTYLHQLLCLPQEEGAEAEGEGEGEPGARGEGCEHLHLVLKYWRALVQPYPELRRAAAWGLVRCHCANCHPDAPPALAGWVRIERASVGEVVGRRAFWHVARSSLGSAQAQTADAAGPARRPRCLLSMPTHDAPFDDIWLDEDGKPHDTVLVVEIGIDCSEAVNDRLVAFRIYLKAHVAPADDNPSSCDE